MSEAIAIWDRIKRGDTDALEILYRKYFNDLYNYGLRMSADISVVEDAIQETFLNIWKYRHSITVPQSEKAYLLRAYRNQVVQIFRSGNKTSYSEELLHFNFEISFEEKIVEGEDALIISKKVNEAMSSLTERQREIVYYRFFEELSYDKIAEIMNMQTRATYKLAARAIAALRQVLGPRMIIICFI